MQGRRGDLLWWAPATIVTASVVVELAMMAMRRGDASRVVSSLVTAVVSTAYLVGVYVDPLPWLRWTWE
jgi:hypothetical protein